MIYLARKKIFKKVLNRIDPQLNALFDDSWQFKICMLDRAGYIISWSASAERLTGYAAREMIGRKYSHFVSRDLRHRAAFVRVLAKAQRKGQFTTEGMRVRKDGSHFWAQSFIIPVKKKNGTINFFVVITRDISKQHMRDEKKDAYIGIASHELRNPLATLSLYTELLENRLHLEHDKKNLQMLRDMQGQTARLVTLVDDLLLVSKAEKGTIEMHWQVFNLHVFLKGIVKAFQSGVAKHRIVLTGHAEGEVRADKGRMTQVVLNLLSNAVKYSPVTKKVILDVKKVKKKYVVAIRDFGSGISKQDQRQIFTRFYRTEDAEAGNVSGAGLGLYISKEIIKKHKERIWVQSESGKGTTFFFTVSAAEKLF